MFDLRTLSDSAFDMPSDNRFTLDDRTIEDLLKFLQGYSKLIPFDGSDKFWDRIFLSPVNVEQLAALYQQPNLADGSLRPQQALLLAFYRLLETPKTLLNRLPAMHRQLYYCGLLGLKPREMVPDRVALSCQLEKGTRELLLPAGMLMEGGQDSQGNPVQYALDKALLANQGQWNDLRWCQPGKSSWVSRVLFDQSNKIDWPVAGVRLFNLSATEDQEVVTGRVIGSELLAMSGGERTITVMLEDNTATPEKIQGHVSSGGQWLVLSVTEVTEIKDKLLTFTLPATAGAMTPPVGLDGFTSAVPLLKLSRHDGLPVPKVAELCVEVTDFTQVMYRTDDGVDKVTGSSYPFGYSPVMGNGFNLIAADWCNKPQTLTITLKPEWLNLPEMSFDKWYAGYDSQIGNNDIFKVASLHILEQSSSLFVSGSQSDVVPTAQDIKLSVKNLTGQPINSVDPLDWQDCFRLELNGHDFLHQEYLTLLSQGKTGLNPPYTPQIKSLVVSYSGTDTKIKEQYVLTPFGYGTEQQVSAMAADDPPQLYLGFSDIEPGQELTLHWQLKSPQPQEINWQYLNQENSWHPLDATVNDNTESLFASGLWSAPLPEDAAQGAQMPAGRYWLRAVVKTSNNKSDPSISVYPRLQGLRTNAVTATLVNGESLDDTHFHQPLPAGTVNQPVQRLKGLAQVEQPWPSQGGRMAESESAFLPRVAQRLSHRGRALTWSDMVALLSEGYPEIGNVHIPLSEQLSGVPARTTQQLIVIPANGEQDNNDLLKPKFAPSRLVAMQNYLQALSSPWVKISVVNPDYRSVPVQYEVTFIQGTNTDYGNRQLKQRLERQYMPWAWDGQSSAAVGTELDYYAMVAFIQQLPFVERVVSLTLDEKCESVVSSDTQVLILTWPNAS
ncbi:hypothetical protein [Photorhabdus sp. RM71S]|uniref:hypothetical protein n=1 Tax=Photorhabdus sp. RM71S TaxID=3342824 RepID=UPI0036DC6A49